MKLRLHCARVLHHEPQSRKSRFKYVQDAAALGMPKGWIMLGHAVSEEEGMLEMADWIKSFTREVPLQLLRAGEPFWVPQ